MNNQFKGIRIVERYYHSDSDSRSPMAYLREFDARSSRRVEGSYKEIPNSEREAPVEGSNVPTPANFIVPEICMYCEVNAL